MNKIKRLLSAMMILAPILLAAQGNIKGIQWTTDFSWEQVLEKAKKENKYVFLDCYTTWCGPCKMMDKYVYVNDTVADYFNEKFLCVRMQMDQTNKDDEYVKNSYSDAVMIGKKYHIEAFPTLIFISPTGVVMQQQTGFRGVNDLIALAEKSILPGEVYKDPYSEYEQLVTEYRQGVKHYDRMVYMIKAAMQFDRTLASQLAKDYINHVSTLPLSKRYSRENIEFWSMFTLNSSSKEFQFFYKDERTIDKVMNQPGYAAREVDKTVFSEIVLPFLEKRNKDPKVQYGGMGMYRPNAIVDYAEADWKGLGKIITHKYNSTVSERNVLKAKIEWYNRHDNKIAAARVYLTLINKFSLIPEADDPLTMQLNYKAFESFMLITDMKIIRGYIPWMKKLVDRYPEFYSYLDTYANLLYKAGNRSEAIQWQEKAAHFSLANGDPNAAEFKRQLDNMRRAQPTYCEQVNWNGVKWIKWEGVKLKKRFNVKNVKGELLSGVSVRVKDKEATKLISNGGTSIDVSIGDVVIISKEGYLNQEVVIDKTGTSPTIVLRDLP